MSLLKKDAVAAASLAGLGAAAGYGDLKMTKREEDKKRIEENSKEDKKPSSGGDSKAKATPLNLKKGGSVKSSASKRADGCCVKGKTKGRMV